MESHDGIFLSYARADLGRVRWIYDGLCSKKFSVFFDEHINPAEVFENVIVEKIQQCQCVLVVLSRASAQSEWVQKELAVAKAHDKLVVPVAIDAFDGDIPLGFAHLNVVDLSRWQGNDAFAAWQQLVSFLKAHIAPCDTRPKDPSLKAFFRECIEPTESQMKDAQLTESGERTQVIRARSKEEYDRHMKQLLQKKYRPERVEADFALFRKDKQFNWGIAIIAAICFVIPLLVYLKIHEKLPATEYVRLVLVQGETGEKDPQ